MSTSLGQIEVLTRKSISVDETKDLTSSIYMTAFHGGDRGRMLQLTVQGGDSMVDTAYAHLTPEEAEKLRDKLNQFINKDY